MKNELIVSRIFDVPVKEIWKPWSDSEYVKQWWGPGFTTPIANMDFREGGISLVCMNSSEQGDLYNTWTYTKIIPPKRIEFTLNWADKEGNKLTPSEAGMPAELPFEAPHEIIIKDLGNDKSELTVVEYGYATKHMAQVSKAGLEQCLDKMAAMFLRISNK